MSQEFSLLFSGFIGALLGATIVGSANLYINRRRSAEDKAKREEDQRKEASKAFLDEARLLLNERMKLSPVVTLAYHKMTLTFGCPLPG